MATIKIKGDTSGEISLTVPGVAGTNTLTLPASTGNVITDDGSGNVNISGSLSVGSIFSGNIVNMSFVTLSSISTGTAAASYTTAVYGGITQYVTSHAFNYGFTASSASKVFCIAMQQNSNQGGHTSMYAPQITGKTTTGATLSMKDVASSSGVDMGILCVEIA